MVFHFFGVCLETVSRVCYKPDNQSSFFLYLFRLFFSFLFSVVEKLGRNTPHKNVGSFALCSSSFPSPLIFRILYTYYIISFTTHIPCIGTSKNWIIKKKYGNDKEKRKRGCGVFRKFVCVSRIRRKCVKSSG
jgi:hypothetical protein